MRAPYGERPMHRFAALFAGFALLAPASAFADSGLQVWNQAGCGGCHTLAAAGANGDGGPNLDQLRPPEAAVAAQVTHGGPGMPAFGGSLSSSQIAAIAAFVSSSTGGSSATASLSSSASSGATTTSMSASAVRRIQTALARLGFFQHSVTGVYGPVTQAAVASFQQSVGLTADGVWGPKTAAALKTAGSTSSTSLPPPRAWVRRLQRGLAKLGFFHHAVTGVYGPITTAAVRSFQRSVGLTADGKWGTQSAAALTKRLRG